MNVESDTNISDLIKNKIPVIYTANALGEYPNTFTKQFIPSSISVEGPWFVGYTPFIIEGFNMIPVSENILFGLQFFNIIDGSIKKYDKFGNFNDNNEKIKIILTDDEKKAQIEAKKIVVLEQLKLYSDKKINTLFSSYGTEKETWNIQIEEANNFKNGIDDITFISVLAEKRGISLELLVEKIIEKNKIFREQSATIIGEKQNLVNKIKNSNSNEELNNIYLSLL